MGLFKRVGHILSANLNELVDGMENPETMLNQAVREMECTLRAAMDSAAKVIASEKLFARQLAENDRKGEQWKHRALEMVRNDDEAAARSALTRKNEHEKMSAALSDQRAAAEQAGLRLRRQIDAMRVRLAEARRKQVTLAARRRAAVARKAFATEFGHTSIDTTSLSRFDRMQARIERSEAEADALWELADVEGPLDQDYDLDVETELKAIKQSLTGSSHDGTD
jgi:phage shock protein A